MKTILIITILFLSLYCANAQWGHWEKLEPENSPSPRYNHDLASIGNNKVLLFGGNSGYDHSDLNDTWIYDYSEDNWYQIQCDSSPAPRNDHRMIQISEKEVLLYAGTNYYMIFFDDVWIFNLDSLNWFRIETINNPKGRSGHNISKYSDNEVLVFGGRRPFFNSEVYTNETWIYNVDTREWREIKDVDESLEGRYSFMMANDENFRTIMYGGWNNRGSQEDTWSFIGTQWKKINNTGLDFSNASGDMEYIKDNIFIMFGGTSNMDSTPETWNDNTWLHDSRTEKWRRLELDHHPVGRIDLRLARIDSNKVLMFGGSLIGTTDPWNETWIFTLDSVPTTIENDGIFDNFISIYPNPASDYIEVQGEGDVRIYDVLGNVVVSLGDSPFQGNAMREADGGSHKIDISALPRGVYFAKIGERVSKFVKM